MQLTQLLHVDHIRVPLRAQTKEAAIEELVGVLDEAGQLSDPAAVRDAVLERESTRTTGIGDGLAIPHGKTDAVDHLVLALGKAGNPLDFGAIDGKPVNLVWLLSSPTSKTGPHIEALAAISKLMAKATVRKAMVEATTPEGILEVLREAESEA